jgi:hypothetical protein
VLIKATKQNFLPNAIVNSGYLYSGAPRYEMPLNFAIAYLIDDGVNKDWYVTTDSDIKNPGGLQYVFAEDLEDFLKSEMEAGAAQVSRSAFEKIRKMAPKTILIVVNSDLVAE